jgi:FkbM family methyltransferase
MGKFEAARNILQDLTAQFQWDGALAPRFLFAGFRYAIYVAYRAAGRTQDESHHAALVWLGPRLGLSSRMVRVRLPLGVAAEFDLMTAAFLVKELLVDGAYEAFPEFIPGPGQVVVDVGAHQGVFSLQAARRVGPTGRVVSIEASPRNQDILERNIAANGFHQVTLVRAAAADFEGEVALYEDPLGSASNSIMVHEAGCFPVKVRARTLSGILAELGISRVDILKIDVEFAGLAVLKGGAAALAARPRVVMEVEGAADQVDAARRFLENLGYRVRTLRHILYADPPAGG